MSKLPDRDDLVAWIRDNPHNAGKREIARAFGLKGADREALKRMLRDLEDEGAIERRRKRVRGEGHLPPVAVLVAGEPNRDGDIGARPKDWEGAPPPPPVLYVPRRGDPAIGAGDRFLAKLRPVHEGEGPGGLSYEARLIKKLAAGPRRMLGIFRTRGAGGRMAGRVVPVDKRSDREWQVPEGATGGARDGELVEAESSGAPRMGLPTGRVVEVVGDASAPRQVSLIAMREHGIEDAFPADALAEASAARLPGPEGREDLRGLALFTIDPADARDHDDAVAAGPDDDPANPGGHVVWVAIADVAALVRPGTALDAQALARGNSTYFPDRVAPMLPDRLSGDLLSLHAGVERPCLAVRMVLGADGGKRGHRFVRGVMASRASLTYEQVEAERQGHGGPETAPLRSEIGALYAAYGAAAKARDRRQPLDLDLPERRIELDAAGTVTGIPIRERLEAHRLIEEFMILANVCAAETLEERKRPLLYRVHEEPAPERLEALRDSVDAAGLALAKGQVLQTRDLNRLLAQARETEAHEMVHLLVLRAQTQAYYAPRNYGHFGLALPRYTHFTSPIRRYADLVVHRALIGALGLGEYGQTPDEAARLAAVGEAISKAERRSMEAERDTVDRYVAAYMADREGAEFAGRINGVGRFGVFVRLDETGADGLVPISSLGREYYRHDPDANTLTGERTGRVLALGMRARVRLVEAVPVTGGLRFELLEATGVAPRSDGAKGKGVRRAPRKADRARVERAKARRRGRGTR